MLNKSSLFNLINLDVDSLMRANEMALTDVRLEALASAHQLDQMKELVCKMKVLIYAYEKFTLLSL